jgi:selenocysteine lyase/cysteine desulfurase
MESEGVTVDVVPCDKNGVLDPSDVRKALEAGAALVVMSAASNVTGSIMPVREVGETACQKGVPLLVDSAQAGGVVPLNMKDDCIDLLAFTGHKSLYGPPGTGGLIFGSRVDEKSLRPLIEGGTGSRSEDEIQPLFLPDRFESGTQNGAGLAGLHASLNWLMESETGALLRREQSLAERLREGLASVSGVKLYGPDDVAERTGVLSFTIAGIEVSEIGERLDEDFGIMTRVGLHCAPAAHRTIGTFPEGTVRVSVGAFTAEKEVDAAVDAVRSIAAEHNG